MELSLNENKVADGDANFTLGALTPSTTRADKHSWSYTYYYAYMLYAIPSGKSYTSLEKLFFPFAKNVWLCICTLFVIAVAIIVILKQKPKRYRDYLFGQSNNTPLFNLVNACLGGSIPLNYTPARNFARTMLLIWLLATLVLRNAYQGKLFDNMRKHQRKAPFYHLNELYDSNVKLYLPEAYYQTFVDNFPQHKHR